MPTETDIQRSIQLELSNGPTRLWRFQIGNFELLDGRRIQVGIAGMSDLLGLHSVTITPDMVGRTLAVFVACEVKNPLAHTEKERLKAQQMYIDAVRRMGGLAGFADSPEDARRILAGEILNGH